MIRDDGIAKLDDNHVSGLLEWLTKENRLKSGIELFPNIL